MYTIETAAGRKHDVTMCGEAGGYLHIRLADGSSFAAVVKEFSNAENTSAITYRFGEMEKRHEGYTTLEMVQWEGGKAYHVMLKHQDQE